MRLSMTSSDEMEITIVDDDEDETFTSDGSATATSPVNDVLRKSLIRMYLIHQTVILRSFLRNRMQMTAI